MARICGSILSEIRHRIMESYAERVRSLLLQTVFFSANGIPMQAVDMTGAAPEELYALVSQDTPVLVWVTIGMEDRRETQGWYTETGDYVDWSTNDHGAVLIGYTETTVTIGDPISGQVEYDRQQFESVFASRGNQCVILEEE